MIWLETRFLTKYFDLHNFYFYFIFATHKYNCSMQQFTMHPQYSQRLCQTSILFCDVAIFYTKTDHNVDINNDCIRKIYYHFAFVSLID